MRARLFLFPALALVAGLAVASHRPDEPRDVALPARNPDPVVDGAATPTCVSGCGVAADGSSELTLAEYRSLIKLYAREALGSEPRALETLLFHAEHTLRHVEAIGLSGLDDEHAAFLMRELGRDHGALEVRLLGTDGTVRLRLEPNAFPIGRKQHVRPEHVVDMAPPELSGTLQRVGLDHIWTRL
jgi:hypothetical protein